MGGLQRVKDFGRNRFAAFSVGGVDLVFVATSVEGSAPTAIAEDDAVMLKGAKGKTRRVASAGVNVCVAVSAGLECLSDPVLESELSAGSSGGHRSW